MIQYLKSIQFYYFLLIIINLPYNYDKYNFYSMKKLKYNYKNTIKFKGSAIFLHLTKNYSPTKGCVALSKKDFLILIKLIDKKTKIKII